MVWPAAHRSHCDCKGAGKSILRDGACTAWLHVAMMPEHIQQPTLDGLDLLTCDARRASWDEVTPLAAGNSRAPSPVQPSITHILEQDSCRSHVTPWWFQSGPGATPALWTSRVTSIRARVALSKPFLRCGHPVSLPRPKGSGSWMPLRSLEQGAGGALRVSGAAVSFVYDTNGLAMARLAMHPAWYS